MLKYGIEREFSNLAPDVCSNLTEYHVQLQEVVKQHLDVPQQQQQKTKEAILKENGFFKRVVASLHITADSCKTSKEFSLEKTAKPYKPISIKLAISPKEHFEDNLNKLINNEIIADDDKLILLQNALRRVDRHKPYRERPLNVNVLYQKRI